MEMSNAEECAEMSVDKITNGASLSNYQAIDGKPRKKRKKYTIEDAMNAVGWGKFQLWVSAICGLGSVTEAMEMMLLTILSPALHCGWGVSSSEQALVTTFVFIGMMIGAASWGWICDRYGRKRGVLVSFVITFYFGFLSAFSPSIYWIYVLRGIVGFAFIGGSQTSTMQVEFTTTPSRVNNLLVMHLFWALGTFSVIAVAVVVMPSLGWRWQLILCALPLVISTFIIWKFLPESIRYHVTTGQVKKAMKTLEMMSRHNNKPLPEGKLFVPSSQVNSEKPGRFSDLFKPELRRTTITLWYIWFAAAFSYYGISLLTTELLKTSTGCPTKGQHSTLVACSLECKVLDTHDYTRLLVVTLAEFAAIPNSFFWVKFLSRRITLFVLYSSFTLFTGLLATCISKAAITGFSLVIRMFCSSIFQVTYLYTLEVYPTAVRALGLGSSSSAARVGGVITPFIAQVLLQKSVYATVGVYAVVGFLAAIMAVLLPIETKDQAIKDFTSPDAQTIINEDELSQEMYD